MLEFTMTRITELGNEVTEFGRASAEDIDNWNREIREAVRAGDNAKMIKISTIHEGEWSGGYVRAILVKSVDPKVKRPESWK
jgi:hypothetical protein